MKIETKGIFFLLLLITTCNYNVFPQDSRLMGKWVNNEDYSDINYIEFKNENIVLLFQGEKQSPPFVFITDFTKEPVWINMKVEENGIEAKILGLLHFINPDKIKIEFFYGEFEEQPTDFSLNKNSQSQLYIFNRLK
ncbi:hypothetical protein D0817_13230 [Flavobacterium cupreum]|uniref:Lipocalin-like domain-containing protein n=1 Tax=Flavobacterium cupreum TaxID=2133766 RepID=A0A434A6U7_9FLAO|nr:hypothetical protein [Flavobacterium cupreum]RUT70133.1 hypothetical protein D0817_13230 [Flavobacterium cupreum]